MLREHSAHIVAYDKHPPSHAKTSKENSYHGRAKAWTSVEKGGMDKLAKHSDNSLFLCYPPPDSDMALQALRLFPGEIVCYVGEYRGDTGTAKFESLLESTFLCIENIPLPNWGDTCYCLTVWSRVRMSRPINSHKSKHPASCTMCGKLDKKMYRCRLTYGVTYCSSKCAISCSSWHKDELTYKFLLYNLGKKRKYDNETVTAAIDESTIGNVQSSIFQCINVKLP